MSEARTVYNELRDPLLRTGALVAALGLIVFFAGWFNAQADLTRQSATQTFQEAVQEYRTAVESERILRTEAERFAALREQGFVGAEPRLRWVQAVREAAGQAGVVRIRYELEPRRAHATTQATGSYQLFASVMKLQLELRHEGDLFRFIELLTARRAGLFEATACTLRRSGDRQETRLEESNVSVDCALNWYSLDAPSAVIEGEPS